MIINPTNISLRQDEDGVWIAASDLLPGCHAWGKTEMEAVFAFQDASKAHLEALNNTRSPHLQKPLVWKCGPPMLYCDIYVEN